MAKRKNDYFELLKNQAAATKNLAGEAEALFCEFSPEKEQSFRKTAQALSKEENNLYTHIFNSLLTEFIAPIEPNDICLLSETLHLIFTKLFKISDFFYAYSVPSFPKSAPELGIAASSCVNALYEAVCEFKSFKKPEAVSAFILKTEELCAGAELIYTKSLHKLFSAQNDVQLIFSSKALYSCLEECCDLCRRAAFILKSALINNS